MDSVLIANECQDSGIKLGELRILCKPDMEKTYDCANWNFLFYILANVVLGGSCVVGSTIVFRFLVSHF